MVLAAAKAVPDDKASSENPDAADEFKVGDRVWVNGNKPGYIQFLGETQFAPGQWAGIVLDEPIGKNDGSVAGVRYFQSEPLRGIFTRPSKLSRTEGEANGTTTAPASPTPSTAAPPAAPPATPAAAPADSAATKKATKPASNLTRSNSESVSNLSEAGSVKKGERELKMGDRVLVSTLTKIPSGDEAQPELELLSPKMHYMDKSIGKPDRSTCISFFLKLLPQR